MLPDAQSKIQMDNRAGYDGLLALNRVIDHCDLQEIAAWRALDGSDLGNCFFSSTNAAMDLVLAGVIDNGWLVTGRFDHPDMDEPVFHAWLEFRDFTPAVVVNVSMLHRQPFYAVPQPEYYSTNNCRWRLQEIPFKRLKIKIMQMARRNRKEIGSFAVDCRVLTKKVLKPTLDRVARLQAVK
jgi:hypothetical protein